jgi:hypothetical protein
MISKAGRSMLMLGMAAQFVMLPPAAAPASAQRWEGPAQDRGWNRDRDRDRHRWEGGHGDRGEWRRRERERRRRNDAKTDGVVAGVVGTALVAGIIVAATSGKKKDRRAEYCRDRYGNYDRESDGYRGPDGRLYRCD